MKRYVRSFQAAVLCLAMGIAGGCSPAAAGGTTAAPETKTQAETTKAETTAAETAPAQTAAPAAGGYTAGTYTGTGYGHNGKILVELTCTENEITEVKVTEHGETAGICDAAIERIPAAVVQYQSLGIDAISGATDSSKGILEAAADCVAQAGGDVEALKAAAAETGPAGEQAVTEMSCDVCVVGAGASGSVAAIQAAELGANVLLLEKSASAGMRGDGFFAVSSPLLETVDCEPVDIEVFFKEYMQDTSWRADGTLVRDWLEMSGGTVEYLMSHGCEFVKPVEEYSGGHSYAGGYGFTQYDGSERTTAQQMAEALEFVTEKGGQFLCDTAATGLITDEKGTVLGVTAVQADGTALKITAKAVILATGGYNADAAWVADAYDGIEPTNNFGPSGNVGDGIRMAVEAGAAERGEQAVMLRMPRLVGDFNAFNEYESGDGQVKLGKRFQYAIPLLPMTLWVNGSGERFADENEVCYNRNYCGNVVMSQGGSTYIIITQEMLQTLAEKGASTLGLLQPQGMGYNNEYTQMDLGWGDVMMVADGLVEQGVAYRGETVKELAEAAGMDEAALTRTLEEYNAACAGKEDPGFYKDKQYLYPMEEGPYYMFTLNVNVLTTLGGVRVSRYMEAVSYDAESRGFTPVPGLFACGTCTGGIYGDHYANAEGIAQSYCYTSARTAACYAVNEALGTDFYHLDLVKKEQ